MGDYRYEHGNNEPVSVSEWLITALIMVIPLVNIIMPFVWAFGNGTKISKSNFFKAQLVIALIAVVFYFLFAGTLFSYIRIPSQMMF